MNRPVVAVVIGTRPEAIKMIPVLRALKAEKSLRVLLISTGQHHEMLDQILDPFEIRVDHDMGLMEPRQTLYGLSSRAISSFEAVLNEYRPKIVLVQGDTTTAMLGGLCAFYGKIAVGHVEAGLRTGDKHFPFPEETNRRLLSVLADLHFAPTEANREALLAEGVAEDHIFVTGNTVIDTLQMARRMELPPLPVELKGRRLVLVTAHRRESFGKPLREMFAALRELADAYPDVVIVYPVHLNPNVQQPANELLGGVSNIHLCQPAGYFEFVHLMSQAELILTDSGGVQEEAPSLGVPVLVMRNETERVEGIAAGTVRLVGTQRADIVHHARLLLDDADQRRSMSAATNPYGDGHAGERITGHVMAWLKAKKK
jgi:UDP-N-acetylglucosamine 2-epimerase (non-hydrolysing)